MKWNLISRTLFFLMITSIVISSCSPSAQDITQGVDRCAFCQMNIVDIKFGAEIVTDKGKVYKFDAIECMMNFNYEFDKPVEMYLVNTVDEPGVLHPAQECHYLISEAVPSPMGANLSAYTTEDQPKKILESEEGEYITWTKLEEELIERDLVD